MSDQNEEVIDLTNSFTLVDHENIKGVIIDLESDSTSDAQTEHSASTTSTCTRSKRQTRSNSSSIPTPSTTITIYDLCTPENKVKKRTESSTVAQEQTTSKPTNKKRNSDMDMKHCCAICLETFGTRPLASTKCGHVFCFKCITMALRAEPKCPTCRRKLKGVNAVHPIFL